MQAGRTPARVLVVGAGPAGMSCALWLHNLGLKPCLVDSGDQLGGLMNRNTLSNNWVLGQCGQTGPEIAASFARHLTELALEVRLNVVDFQIQPQEADFLIQLGREAPEQRYAAIVWATGTRIRAEEVLAHIPGVDTLPGDLLRFGPAAFEDIAAAAAQGLTLVIGGGDNAIENAHMLAQAGGRVLVLARSRFRAQAALMASVAEHAGIRCLEQAVPTQFDPHPQGVKVSFLSPAGNEDILVQRLHVLAGYEPNADFGRYFVESVRLLRDAQGYLRVDAWGRTSVPGVYAAGDVCNPAFPSVVSAIAQGAQVAKAIERDLRLVGNRKQA